MTETPATETVLVSAAQAYAAAQVQEAAIVAYLDEQEQRLEIARAQLTRLHGQMDVYKGLIDQNLPETPVPLVRARAEGAGAALVSDTRDTTPEGPFAAPAPAGRATAPLSDDLDLRAMEAAVQAITG